MKFSNRNFGLILILLLVLNYIDALFTLHWISEDYAIEINPLMNSWLQIGNEAFLFIKLSIVAGATLFLWRAREYKLAHILVFLVFLFYLCIFLIHCNIAWKVFFN